MARKFSALRFSGARPLALAIAGLALTGVSASKALEDEQAAITQVVLKDASERWRGARPCISDDLKSFDGKPISRKRISELAHVEPLFAKCHSSNLSAMNGDRFVTISAPKITKSSATIEFDYICPTCGKGTLYILRKLKGRWSVASRQTAWNS